MWSEQAANETETETETLGCVLVSIGDSSPVEIKELRVMLQEESYARNERAGVAGRRRAA